MACYDGHVDDDDDHHSKLLIPATQVGRESVENTAIAAAVDGRRLVYLPVPSAGSDSFLQRIASRLFFMEESPPAERCSAERIENTRAHKDTIRTLLDEFLKRQEDLKNTGRVAAPSGEPAPSAGGDAATGDDAGHLPMQVEPGAADHLGAKRKHPDKQLESFLILFSKSLQLYGCPTHVLQFHMEEVSKGLGLPKAHFSVFPTFTLVAFNREDYKGINGPAIVFRSAHGLDMYRLQLADEIARRVASYASLYPPAGATDEALAKVEAAVAPDLVLKVGQQHDPALPEDRNCVTHRSGFLVPVDRPIRSAPTLALSPSEKELQYDQPQSPADQHAALGNLREMILTLSSFGPGFFFYHSKKNRNQAGSNIRNGRYEDAFAKMALEDANERLQLVLNMEPLYPMCIQPLLWGMASGGSAVLYFGGGWLDMVVSFVMGALVGIIGNITNAVNFLRIYEFCSSVLVGFMTRTLVHAGLPVCFAATTLSSVIWLLQGLSITMSTTEIVTRNMVSGVTRLGYALLITAIIGYGIDVGHVLAETMLGTATPALEVCAKPVNPAWYILLFVPTLSAFDMMLQAHHSQLPSMLAVQAVAFVVSYFAGSALTWNVAVGLSAFVVGVISNLYARLLGNPPVIYIIGALIILVPGAMAVRGFSNTLTSKDSGVSLAGTVLLSAISIAIGLFIANLVSPTTELNALARAKSGRISNLAF